MVTYPQKHVDVNNYHYFYIYLLRVNHKTQKPQAQTPGGSFLTETRYTELANKQPLLESFCPPTEKIHGRLPTCGFGDV